MFSRFMSYNMFQWWIVCSTRVLFLPTRVRRNTLWNWYDTYNNSSLYFAPHFFTPLAPCFKPHILISITTLWPTVYHLRRPLPYPSHFWFLNSVPTGLYLKFEPIFSKWSIFLCITTYFQIIPALLLLAPYNP